MGIFITKPVKPVGVTNDSNSFDTLGTNFIIINPNNPISVHNYEQVEKFRNHEISKKRDNAKKYEKFEKAKRINKSNKTCKSNKTNKSNKTCKFKNFKRNKVNQPSSRKNQARYIAKY